MSELNTECVCVCVCQCVYVCVCVVCAYSIYVCLPAGSLLVLQEKEVCGICFSVCVCVCVCVSVCVCVLQQNTGCRELNTGFFL